MARALLIGIALAVLAAAGLGVDSYVRYLLALAMVNVIVAIGLNLLTGNAGQISLSHASFMAMGAYGTTLMMTNFGVPFWVAIPISACGAAAIGALLGFPASRLSGIYLALVTLGFLEIVQLVIAEFPGVTGGVRGLSVPKPALIGGARLPEEAVYLLVLAACAFSMWTALNLLHSRVGREFNAIRQSPHAAQALGVSVSRVKLVAFALSAAYAAVGGGLLAIVVGFIDPIEFGVSTTLRHITFIVVGGLGSVAGSVIGAVALSALPELLRPVKEYSDLIYTVILLVFLLFLPKGLVTGWEAVKRPLSARAARAAQARSSRS